MPRDTYLPLAIKPGAWRNGTRYEAAGRWYDVAHVRWTNGRLRPIGGWQKFSLGGALSAPARGLHAWRGNNFARYLAIGTANGLLVHDNSIMRDITPNSFVPGRGNSAYGLGWGVGKYGEDAYGTQRAAPGSIVLDAATWALDSFGETLVACCTSDGLIYKWNPVQFALTGGAEKPTRIVNAPSGVSSIIVTEERHLVALGVNGNPRRVKWSSRENYEEWAVTATTTAGDLDVTSPGKLVCGARWRGGTLLFTDVDLHLMEPVGSPLVYGIDQVSGSNGIIGPKAAVSTGARVAWMSPTGFWQYDGVARQIPCDVQDYVFKDINVLQGAKVVAGHNSQFNEIWWHYPTKDSVENNRYVVWNYEEGWWSFGPLARTAWVDKGVWPHIVAAGADGHLYQHEDGWTDSGASRVGQVFAESGAIELGRGERLAEVRQLIPDADDDPEASGVSFKLRENPQAQPVTVGPFHFNQANGYFDDARFAARQIEMRIEATKDKEFTVGTLRADVVPGSGR